MALDVRGNLLARMLTPVLELTAIFELSMSGEIVETLPKRSWRTSPASNCGLFPHLQQLWGVTPRALPLATLVVSATSAAIPAALQM